MPVKFEDMKSKLRAARGISATFDWIDAHLDRDDLVARGNYIVLPEAVDALYYRLDPRDRGTIVDAYVEAGWSRLTRVTLDGRNIELRLYFDPEELT